MIKTGEEWKRVGPTRQERNRPKVEYTVSPEAKTAIETMADERGIPRSQVVDEMVLDAWQRYRWRFPHGARARGNGANYR